MSVRLDLKKEVTVELILECLNEFGFSQANLKLKFFMMFLDENSLEELRSTLHTHSATHKLNWIGAQPILTSLHFVYLLISLSVSVKILSDHQLQATYSQSYHLNFNYFTFNQAN